MPKRESEEKEIPRKTRNMEIFKGEKENGGRNDKFVKRQERVEKLDK